MRVLGLYACLLITIVSCGLKATKNTNSSKKRTAKELLKHSINYHDPKGNWEKFKSKIRVTSSVWNTEKDIETSIDELFFDKEEDIFKIHTIDEEIELIGEIRRDTCYLKSIDVLSVELSKKYEAMLNCEGVKNRKNYYSFLIGLPMKLTDENAIVSDTILKRVYNQHVYDVLKVNYKPIAKNPSWYFYFHQKTHVLQLCKFTSLEDENKGGEYILFTKEQNVKGMQLKTEQVWFHNTAALDTLAVSKLHFY